MNTDKAELLEKALTFDTTSHPDWRGDEGKCWVDLESGKITIVGWMSDMGSRINTYRLVVQSKQRSSKSGVTQWIELLGWSDSNQEINQKVFGTIIEDALDVMLQVVQGVNKSVTVLAASVANLCSVKRASPYFGQPDQNGVFDSFPEPKKRTPPKGRPVTARCITTSLIQTPPEEVSSKT